MGSSSAATCRFAASTRPPTPAAPPAWRASAQSGLTWTSGAPICKPLPGDDDGDVRPSTDPSPPAPGPCPLRPEFFPPSEVSGVLHAPSTALSSPFASATSGTAASTPAAAAVAASACSQPGSRFGSTSAAACDATASLDSVSEAAKVRGPS
ncbi:hypothetical protein Vafri_14785 [Volvox africanus]|uniref:Uncharacterized protein n=1 Tax=Volvox africanus TaxID=51714 RepID=A0A8J4BFA6_9CHLO|nr:hypothetical protein Vafri_14785 [Volvox africanus]